ncbi:rod shape-determining protein RodA [Bacteroidales bacterium OttesenSCG-928-C19]|nr:rod shape-determining protein RodA [Bacteroidales bacterium OttesenSCG-928-C19]
MKTKERNIIQNINWSVVFIYLALIFIGWINIYAAVYDGDHASIFDFDKQYGKQFVWIMTAIVVATVILVVDAKFFSSTAYVIYGVFIVLLLAVFLFGSITKGALGWIKVGPLTIQPSEFAKFATSLALAKYLSRTDVDFQTLRAKLKAFAIVLFPMAIILLQNDTGSALVFLSLILVLYREGLSGKVLVWGVAAVLLFIFSLLINEYLLIGILAVIMIITAIFIDRTKKNITKLIAYYAIMCIFVLSVDYAFNNILQPHQTDRIEILLGLKEDNQGAGYNVNQSKIAIGSGGLLGKGYLNGTQTKYNFVPEQETDFIFCTVGEEWGFLGCFVVIGLYIWLFIKLIQMAERQRSVFSRIYGYCVACILFMHFFINIGMAIGLLPVIGIPLPFLSYGGSSLWAFTILLFIFIRQDAVRTQLV